MTLHLHKAHYAKVFVLLGLMLAYFTSLNAQTIHGKINYRFTHATLQEFVKVIEKNSSYSFIYNEEIKLNKKINITINNKSIEETLNLVFSEQPITYQISGIHILLKKKQIKPVSRRYTISGYVTDGASQETLIGANIFESRHQEGTSTNPYGFFSLTIPEGETSIQYSYIGYATQTKSFYLKKDTVINVRLKTNTRLQEIVILSDKPETGINATQMGAIDIPIDHIRKTPSVLGEADLMKTLQLMPGVQAGVEGSAGIYVRGGSPDQNLILLDGVPVYNIDHLFGFFSVFTPEAVKKVSLFKSSFPARFGGRLSSVIDIRTNDGDMTKYHGSFSIGLLSSKISLEGPIIKNRTSFNISARRSYFDILSRPFIQGDDRDLSYYFYDINAKINHRFSDKSRLFFSFYNGKDFLKNNVTSQSKSYSILTPNNEDTPEYEKLEASAQDHLKIQWGNTIAAIRWNYMFNNKLFSNSTVSFNRYNFKMGFTDYETNIYKNTLSETRYQAKYQSGIKDWSYTLDFDYSPIPTHHIKFGGGYLYHHFRPEVMTSRNYQSEVSTVQDTTYYSIPNPDIYAHELSAYIEDNFDITPRLSINAGIHFSAFLVQHESYFSAQPRLSARYKLLRDFTIKASYTKMSQYIHLLSSSAIALPTDLWVPVTKRIRPMQAHQFSLGSYYTGIKNWEFSLESYYKNMINVLEYKDGSNFVGSSAGWENKVEMGTGRSFGIELLAQKTAGRITGWLAYTLAKSDRKFRPNGINNGIRFPYKYDRRHSLSLVVNYKLSEKIDLNSSWTFNSGGTATIAEEKIAVIRPVNQGQYFDPTQSQLNKGQTITTEDYVEHRNNYRVPPTHLLNIGINFNKKTKHGIRTWNFSVYNLYDAMNPTFIYKQENKELQNGKVVTKTSMNKITLLPLIPSVTYTYKF